MYYYNKKYYILKFLLYILVIDLKDKTFKVYKKKDFFFYYSTDFDYIILTEKD